MLDDTKTSKGFKTTIKTQGTLRGRTNRSPDKDDAVLIEDNESDDSGKGKGKIQRFTPK